MAGEFILDGFPTQIAFLNLTANGILLPAVIFIEREVKGPKIEVGEIDVKNMRNAFWRPKVKKKLRSVGDIACQMIYDPQVYQLLHTHIGVYTAVKIGLPVTGNVDMTRFLAFDKAWIDSVDPQSHKEGELPTMEVIVKPTMLATGGFNTEQTSTIYQATAPW